MTNISTGGSGGSGGEELVKMGAFQVYKWVSAQSRSDDVRLVDAS